ncbi:hypothetical protein ZWY2020_058910 [Hordeum vulgare]|nr:hypothetical protein ZWY2020_058910 [Hordeum vulgare]
MDDGDTRLTVRVLGEVSPTDPCGCLRCSRRRLRARSVRGGGGTSAAGRATAEGLDGGREARHVPSPLSSPDPTTISFLIGIAMDQIVVQGLDSKHVAKKKKKKKHEQGQGQEHEKHPAGSLPEGPLVEILSRVPYKSLCRFKCVSRPWLALCSDPDIRKRSPQTMAGFFLRNYGIGPCFINISGRGQPLVDPSLSFLRESFTLLIPEQCCGGLILCKYWKSDHFEEDEHSLVVCNPATKKWAELPPNPIRPQDEVDEYLCFDPAVPSRFVVFTHTWDLGEVTIYSSDTGRWTTVESGWIVDTEGKVWRQIDIPGNMRDSSDYPSIGQSQGRLYAWGIDDNINICQLSVWALEDYGGAKWALKDTVNISELFGRDCYKYVEPIAIHPDCDLIFLADRRGKAISYDMDSKKVHVIGTYETFLGAVSYVPCFAEWPSDI